MLLNTEHPSWLAFPDVPQWASHTPRLEVSFPDRELPPHVHQVFHTDSLAEAVRNLLPQSAMQIVYWVFSLAQDGSLAEQFCTHELDASVLHPMTAQPRDVWSREDSGLWSAERKRSALFALRPQPELRSIRLCVGGNSPEECLATWLTVAGWIRTLLRIQCPKQRIPAKAPVVERPAVSPCRARVQKLVRQQVREALLRAAEIETKAGPFRLRGRGHEPRVTLNPRLAATVRGIDLPSEWISGFGPNLHYPLRVFARAAAELERAHGWQVLVVQETRARLAEVPPCTQRSCDCKKGTGAK